MSSVEDLDMKLADRIRYARDGRVAVTRLEVAAAQLKVEADKNLGQTTPQWILDLARVPLDSATTRPRRPAQPIDGDSEHEAFGTSRVNESEDVTRIRAWAREHGYELRKREAGEPSREPERA
ncbi:hypothetical protein OCAE111667_10290 [Occultella aeris]|uniref:Uncharacterized protein n=2 Tax=Occultella aeris TaxID=2761496 RepID=A0A7M4DNF2_9MICO|nr:hypothetical protein HALOF300_03682 [Occultella aeris]